MTCLGSALRWMILQKPRRGPTSPCDPKKPRGDEPGRWRPDDHLHSDGQTWISPSERTSSRTVDRGFLGDAVEMPDPPSVRRENQAEDGHPKMPTSGYSNQSTGTSRNSSIQVANLDGGSFQQLMEVEVTQQIGDRSAWAGPPPGRPAATDIGRGRRRQIFGGGTLSAGRHVTFDRLLYMASQGVTPRLA